MLEAEVIEDPIMAQQIYNLLYTNEDVNNKDTLQVAQKMLEVKHILFQNKNWYLFNDVNGIYEAKDDLPSWIIPNKFT